MKKYNQEITTEEYKGYTGLYKWEEDEQLYYGRLANTNHVITFKGNTLDKVKADFIAAVDDFIEFLLEDNQLI